MSDFMHRNPRAARNPCPPSACASRSSARFFAASARARSISSARSAICARIVTRSGCTSAKPKAIGEVVLLLALAIPELADLERRQQRRVTRAGRRNTLGPRDLHFVDLLVDQRAIGRHDLQLQMRRYGRDRHLCPVLYAALRCRDFSTTSSIVPAM